MSDLLIAVLAGLAGLVIAGLLAAARLSAGRATLAAERARREAAERSSTRPRRRFATLDREQAVAGARVEEAQRLIDEQQRFVDKTRRELETTFQSLAAAALKGSSEQFLALAEQNLARSRSSAQADLDQRKTEIGNLLAPLKETLTRLEQRTGEVERARVEAYSRIDSQVQEPGRRNRRACRSRPPPWPAPCAAPRAAASGARSRCATSPSWPA